MDQSNPTAHARFAAAQTELKAAQEALHSIAADTQPAPPALPPPRKTGGGQTHAIGAPDVKSLWFGGDK